MIEEFVDVIVLGAGAAGFFGSIACKEELPNGRVILIEKTRAPLAKVRISGGGRCNVTHHCFDPKILVQNYPRGRLELLGPFTHFQPKDTIEWYKKRSVALKVEEDGRMFPVTDDSNTIIETLYKAAGKAGVELLLEERLQQLEKSENGFKLEFKSGRKFISKALLIATGSAKEGHQIAESLGHTIEPLCPSLFSFNVPNFIFEELAGVSNQAEVRLKGGKHCFEGPLLITHWGFSGPAVLKLSSFEAKTLAKQNYEVEFIINWLPGLDEKDVLEKLDERKKAHAKKNIITDSPFELPKSLWRALLLKVNVPHEMIWGNASKLLLEGMAKVLTQDSYFMKGKTPYKHEFVTCGGVRLSEVDFRRMESKLVKGLHFAGEVLDIDGVTGGFNFQAAWTTGWIAGKAIAKKLV